MIAATPDAFRLMMDGSAAFADVEERGMRIDRSYLNEAIDWTTNKISEMEAELRADEIYGIWRRKHGQSADISNRNQLGGLVYGELGVKATKVSDKTGRGSTDQEAFEHVDIPFVKRWSLMDSLRRTLTTDLIGIRNELDPYGFLHAFFHLHFVRTYRSSSSDINFQNKPNRNKMLAKLVRRAFIPRGKDYELVEADYGALEFRGAACFWRDDAMVAYASDPSLDIHRDITAECYICGTEQVSKAARGTGKNSFVFPVLYGSYWKSIGGNLWDQATRQGLEVDGVPMMDHLASKGIHNREQFLEHIKKVEENFGNRFPTWRTARDQWWDQYLQNGEFPLMTGFVCRGLYTRNNVMNYPIQGPSFHLLLWSLIQLNKWLVENNFKSCVIGQIHDSIMLDMYRPERNTVLNRLKYIMTEAVKDHWDWIITPLEVEVESSPINWFEKKELAEFNGEWN